MVRWVDVGAEATGVIAIGQQATGVIAIGQLATGVIAIGQLARGVVVVGQLAVGLVSVGQLVLGVAWSAGMIGVGGTSPGWLVLRAFPRRRAAVAGATVLAGAGQIGGPLVPARRALPTGWPLRLVGVAVLAAAWWLLAGDDLFVGLTSPGGVFGPEPGPR